MIGLYRRSGNFHAKKLSYDKVSCKKISQEQSLTALALIVRTNFRSHHRLRNNENFQICSSYFLCTLSYTFRSYLFVSRNSISVDQCIYDVHFSSFGCMMNGLQCTLCKDIIMYKTWLQLYTIRILVEIKLHTPEVDDGSAPYTSTSSFSICS